MSPRAIPGWTCNGWRTTRPSLLSKGAKTEPWHRGVRRIGDTPYLWTAPAERSGDGTVDCLAAIADKAASSVPPRIIQSGVVLRLPPHSKNLQETIPVR